MRLRAFVLGTIAVACARQLAPIGREAGLRVGPDAQRIRFTVACPPDREASVEIMVQYTAHRAAELPFDIDVEDAAGRTVSEMADVSCGDAARGTFQCRLVEIIELDETNPAQPLTLVLRSRTEHDVNLALSMITRFGSTEKIHVRDGGVFAEEPGTSLTLRPETSLTLSVYAVAWDESNLEQATRCRGRRGAGVRSGPRRSVDRGGRCRSSRRPAMS
jgi:hypothetical protein